MPVITPTTGRILTPQQNEPSSPGSSQQTAPAEPNWGPSLEEMLDSLLGGGSSISSDPVPNPRPTPGAGIAPAEPGGQPETQGNPKVYALAERLGATRTVRYSQDQQFSHLGGEKQFKRAFCGPLSDAWLASRRAGTSIFVDHPSGQRMIHGELAGPLTQYGEMYYREAKDAPGRGRVIISDYLEQGGLQLFDVKANQTQVTPLQEPGYYRISMFGPQGRGHAIGAAITEQNGKESYRVFDPDNGEFEFADARSLNAFLRELPAMYDKMNFSDFTMMTFRAGEIPASALGGSDEWIKANEANALVERQQASLAQQEIKTKRKGLGAALRKLGQKLRPQDKRYDPAKVEVQDVVLEGSSAWVSYRDRATQTLLPRLSVAAMDRDFPLLRDYLEAKKAEGVPLERLSKATLNALLNASEEPGAAPVVNESRMLKARLQALRLQEASAKLLGSNPTTGRWVPVLDSLQRVGNGTTEAVSYRILLVNRDNPTQTEWKTTSDRTFSQFKSFMDQELAGMRQSFAFAANGELRGKANPNVDALTNGLNSAFTVQALQRWFSAQSKPENHAENLPYDLSTMLTLYSYLNNTQIALGSADDVLTVVDAVQSLMRPESSVLATTAGTLRGLAGKAGFLLSLGGVIMDGVELSKAPSEMRAHFITQLISDTANAGLGVATMAGAASGTAFGAAVAEIGGPAGVLLAGLGIATAALVDVYTGIARNAANFSGSVQTWHDNLLLGGMDYNQGQSLLRTRPQVVITELNLVQQRVTFGSNQLYPTKHGSTGSGKQNYFFWAGDAPHSVHDAKRALDLRQRLNLPESAALPPGAQDAEVVVLPSLQPALIDYSYNTLPFATARHDAGFDLMRSLEGDDFDFDYYVFPSEWIIDKVSYRYQPKPLIVTLGDKTPRLQMEKPPAPLKGVNLREFDIRAARGQTVIGLQPSGWLNLSSSDPLQTQWVLDARGLDHDEVQFSAQGLSIGGVWITWPAGQSAGELVLLSKDGEMRRIDWANRTQTVARVDAGKWGSAALSAHLQRQAAQHQLSGSSLQVDNYTAADGTPVGRAWYEVAKQRYVYLPDPAQHPNAELALQNGDDVYFYTHNRQKLLKVNADSKQVTGRYDLGAGKEFRVWQHGRDTMVSARAGEDPYAAAYLLTPSGLELKQVSVDAALIERMKSSGDLLRVLKTEVLKNAHAYEAGRKIAARMPSQGELIVDHVEGGVLKQRFSLNARDGSIIRSAGALTNAPTVAANDRNLRTPIMA